MKSLLLFPFLITLLLSSCSGNKYNSAYEAQKACEQWLGEGFWAKYQVLIDGKFYERRRFNRDCIYESETRQYIGEEDISVKKGDVRKYGKEPKYKYKNFYF